MSHSYQHSQPQQRRLLSQNHLNQQINNNIIPAESSFSTSQTLHKHKLPSFSTSTPTLSFFGAKLVSSSSSHQHYEKQQPHSPPISCCFNVSSKRFKFGFAEVSSMDTDQLDFSSLKSPSHINIVSIYNH